jgi:hypothetical protein
MQGQEIRLIDYFMEYKQIVPVETGPVDRLNDLGDHSTGKIARRGQFQAPVSLTRSSNRAVRATADPDRSLALRLASSLIARLVAEGSSRSALKVATSRPDL